jgi:pyruvate kinase
VVDFGRGTDDLIAAVEERLLSIGAVSKGEAVVLVGGTPLGVSGRTNLLKIVRPGEK